MGVDSRLMINAKWTVEDIKTVIMNHTSVEKVEINNTHCTEYHTLYFNYKGEDRILNVHTQYKNPLGICTLMSFRMNENGIELLKIIANVFGGFLEENDCNGNIKEIEGMMNEGDWLPWYLKMAIIENKLNYSDKLDVDELKDYIIECEARYRRV